jgi:thioredoxin 1
MQGNFDNIIQSTVPAVVDFYAEWCGPCKVQSPILKELAAELSERVKVIKIDVDKNPSIAARFQIQGVPTIAVFKDGKMKYKNAGVHSKPQLYTALMNS